MSNRVHVPPTMEVNELGNYLSLRYIYLWMELIGINSTSQTASLYSFKYYFHLFYRYGCWFLSVTSNIVLLFLACFSENMSDNRNSITSISNALIDYFNFGIHAIIIHSFVMLVWVKRFQVLKDELVHSNSLMCLNKGFCSSNLPTLSFVGVLYVVISQSAFILTYAAYLIIDGRNTTFRIILELVAFSSQSYPKTMVVLFCITCKIISHQLKLILGQITNISSNSLNKDEVSNKLGCLQYYHGLICYYTNLLNKCFGSILFFKILFIFVGFINIGASILMHHGIIYRDPFFCAMMGILFTDHVISIFIICLSAESIAKPHSEIKLDLYRLFGHDDAKLKVQAQFFAAQLSELDPKISAADYFYVGKHLVIAIIGAALTYIFIMLQFYTAENESVDVTG